jgi:flagellar protein FlaF
MPSPAKGYARTPTAGNPARSEAWALLETARLIEEAKRQDRDALLDALRRNWRLWTLFQAHLVDAECTLPTAVRSNLLALSNFIDRHTAKLLANPDPAHVEVLVNINRQIGEGLLEGQRSATASPAPATAPTAPTSTTLRESA